MEIDALLITVEGSTATNPATLTGEKAAEQQRPLCNILASVRKFWNVATDSAASNVNARPGV